APIKAQIARLQIPILQVSMADKSFITRGGHPARKLLNELANASLGWVPAGDPERDALYLQICKVVDQVIDQVDEDPAVFQAALTEFNSFVELERRRAALVEQRTIDAEDGRARSEKARATVDQVLRERLQRGEVPAVVRQLLEEGWSNVMFLVALKEGTDSDSWQQALATVDDLLESVAPAESLADRSRLLRTLPGLLKSLRSGLTKVGVNPFLLNDLFTQLEQLHLQRLRRDEVAELVERPVEAADPAEPVPTAGSAEPAVTPVAADYPAGQLQSQEPSVAAASAPQTAASTERLAAELTFTADSSATLEELEEALAAHFQDDEAVIPDAEQPVTAQAPEEQAEVLPVAIRPAPEVLAEAHARVDQLQVGGWVELIQEERILRCRLAAIIRATGKFIFVNRAGLKVAENTREGLAELLASGQLTILDDGRLFDRALESVIGSLREMRGRS
ncbi:MAG: DUF1631 family protein, partial [Spongiibacteraceae bacterium]|nr:DUF1631 family protein [Spongiibacteraceae bacterium]